MGIDINAGFEPFRGEGGPQELLRSCLPAVPS